MRWSDQESISIPAPRAAVFEVLTLVEDGPSWLSALDSARVLAAEGDVRVVELVGAGTGGKRTVVELIQSAPESLLFTQVDRDRRRGISGEVRLLDSHPDTVVRVRLSVPSLPWRLDVRRRLHEGLAGALEALRRRCARSEPAVGSRRLLSIHRRRTGSLELWLDGRLYDLVPRESGADGSTGG